jgi:hypothetical protein
MRGGSGACARGQAVRADGGGERDFAARAGARARRPGAAAREGEGETARLTTTRVQEAVDPQVERLLDPTAGTVLDHGCDLCLVFVSCVLLLTCGTAVGPDDTTALVYQLSARVPSRSLDLGQLRLTWRYATCGVPCETKRDTGC